MILRLYRESTVEIKNLIYQNNTFLVKINHFIIGKVSLKFRTEIFEGDIIKSLMFSVKYSYKSPFRLTIQYWFYVIIRFHPYIYIIPVTKI